MQDGDDVKETFFTTPTKDATPVRIVMGGNTYSIPRNYFRFPQVECRTGETRVMVLRMTLPDFLPATDATWDRLYGRRAVSEDKYIQIAASQQTIKDMAWQLNNFSRMEIKGRSAPPIDGLTSFVQGPLQPNGRPLADVYYAPNAQEPAIIVHCNLVQRDDDPNCTLLVPHNGLVWRPWTARKNLADWREILSGMKARIDSFLVLK